MVQSFVNSRKLEALRILDSQSVEYQIEFNRDEVLAAICALTSHNSFKADNAAELVQRATERFTELLPHAPQPVRYNVGYWHGGQSIEMIFSNVGLSLIAQENFVVWLGNQAWACGEAEAHYSNAFGTFSVRLWWD